MKLIKHKPLRKISITYKEFSRIFNLPKDSDFTMGVWTEGIRVWKRDACNLKDWEAIIPLNEVKKKLNLIKGEKIVDTDYWVFTGYHIIIETNKRILNNLTKEIDKHYKYKFLIRLLGLKPESRWLRLKKWNKFVLGGMDG